MTKIMHTNLFRTVVIIYQHSFIHASVRTSVIFDTIGTIYLFRIQHGRTVICYMINIALCWCIRTYLCSNNWFAYLTVIIDVSVNYYLVCTVSHCGAFIHSHYMCRFLLDNIFARFKIRINQIWDIFCTMILIAKRLNAFW